MMGLPFGNILKTVGKVVGGGLIGGGAAEGLQPQITDAGTSDPLLSAVIGLLTAIFVLYRELKVKKIV